MAKILIIDDDKDFAEAARFILESRNHKAIMSDNTKEGLHLLENEKPDLLILDIMMENKAAGIITSRKLRRDSRFKELPILMITGIREQTGFFFPAEFKNNVFLPVNELIEKPCKPEDLLGKVDELLMIEQST